jgi:hypothetical protein
MSLGSSPLQEVTMMNCNTMLRGAAVAAALLTLSAGAMAQNSSPAVNSGDRGVKTPPSVEEVTSFPQGIPGGQPAIPTVANPMNPNEARPFVQVPEGVRPAMRADNPALPNPRTPATVSESAPAGQQQMGVGQTR